MSTYKVPQDVEAEDKLLGPFSLRQFIYLIVAALSIGLMIFLSKIFVGLALIPLPLVIFFLVLALPLKKDQPMETYMVAMIHFWLKPRLKIWDPEGTYDLVEISVPVDETALLIKEFDAAEASNRLSSVADVVDSRGWSTRSDDFIQPTNPHMAPGFVDEAYKAEDIMDTSYGIGQSIGQAVVQENNQRLENLRANFQASMSQPQPLVEQPQINQPPAGPPLQQQTINSQPQQQEPSHLSIANQAGLSQNLTNLPTQNTQPFSQLQPSSNLPPLPNAQPDELTEPTPTVNYNPYPDSMRQNVIKPIDDSPASTTNSVDSLLADASSLATSWQPQKPLPSSKNPASPDIMRLANDNNLSLSTISKQVNKPQSKLKQTDDEVSISLH